MKKLVLSLIVLSLILAGCFGSGGGGGVLPVGDLRTISGVIYEDAGAGAPAHSPSNAPAGKQPASGVKVKAAWNEEVFTTTGADGKWNLTYDHTDVIEWEELNNLEDQTGNSVPLVAEKGNKKANIVVPMGNNKKLDLEEQFSEQEDKLVLSTTANVVGKCYQHDGSPAMNVRLKIFKEGTMIVSESSSNGEFSFELPAGAYELWMKIHGYAPIRRTLLVDAGADQDVGNFSFTQVEESETTISTDFELHTPEVTLKVNGVARTDDFQILIDGGTTDLDILASAWDSDSGLGKITLYLDSQEVKVSEDQSMSNVILEHTLSLPQQEYNLTVKVEDFDKIREIVPASPGYVEIENRGGTAGFRNSIRVAIIDVATGDTVEDTVVFENANNSGSGLYKQIKVEAGQAVVPYIRVDMHSMAKGFSTPFDRFPDDVFPDGQPVCLVEQLQDGSIKYFFEDCPWTTSLGKHPYLDFDFDDIVFVFKIMEEPVESSTQIKVSPSATHTVTRNFVMQIVATDSPDTTITTLVVDGNSVTVTATGDEDGCTFQYRLDATGDWVDDADGVINLTGLADGQHAIEVKAIDADGLVDDTPASQTFSIDTTPTGAPVVSVTTPTNDTTPTWSWSAVDGAVGYSYSWYGGNWTETTSTSFTPTTALSEGLHTLYVRAKDDSDNWSESGSASCVVDITGPTIVGASNRTVEFGNALNISDISVADDNGIASQKVLYWVNGGVTQESTVFSIPAASNFADAITYCIQAEDNAGNVATSAVYTVTQVDTENPSTPTFSSTDHLLADYDVVTDIDLGTVQDAEEAAAVDASLYLAGLFDLTINTPTDNVEVALIVIDWGDGNTEEVAAGSTTTHTYASTGDYNFSVTVYDSSGNSASDSGVVKVCVNQADGETAIHTAMGAYNGGATFTTLLDNYNTLVTGNDAGYVRALCDVFDGSQNVGARYGAYEAGSSNRTYDLDDDGDGVNPGEQKACLKLIADHAGSEAVISIIPGTQTDLQKASGSCATALQQQQSIDWWLVFADQTWY